jgi:hypothetical protein
VVVDLQEISDRLEIEAALVRYTRAVDTGDWNLLDTVFTPDAQVDYTESGGVADGYPAVRSWLAEVLPAFFPRRMHTLGQVHVDLRGDEADVTAYFHNPMPLADAAAPEGERVVEFGGFYHHSFVRTADGWRSCRLREEIVWRRGI